MAVAAGFIIATCVFVIVVGLVLLCGDPDENKKNKIKRIAELENQNRILRRIKESSEKEIKALRTVISLGLPYPTIEAFEAEEARVLENVKKAIREEYPDIKFTDEK